MKGERESSCSPVQTSAQACRLTCKPNSALEEGRQNASHVEEAPSWLPRSEEYGWCIYSCSTETWWALTSSVPWFCFVQLQGGSRLFSGLLITFHPHALMFRISELAILEMTWSTTLWLLTQGGWVTSQGHALESASGSPHFFPVFSSSLRARHGWFGGPS